MSEWSIRATLTQTCVIERDNASTAEWGDPQTPDWQTHLDGQVCRVWATAGRELVKDGTSIVPAEDLRLLLPLGIDVTEADRVKSVSERGDIVEDGPISIRSILRHLDHIELILIRNA